MRSGRSQLALLAVLGAALAAPLVPARADGDPASDFLLSQSTFLSPFDGHLSSSASTRLVRLLADAKTKGFPIKVAVIVTRYDLGSVPILFKRPKQYAKFLGQEDYYYWKDELLVVMPNGYGLYKAADLPAADQEAIDALPAPKPTDGNGLVAAAERAVTALAERRGIKLEPVSSVSGGSSVMSDRVKIAVAVLVAGLLGLAARFAFRRRRAR